MDALVNKNALSHLRNVMQNYAPLSDDVWQEFIKILSFKKIPKHTSVLNVGDIPKYVYFVHKGLIRLYFLGGKDFDKEVNKNFFIEGQFPASLVASLQQEESQFALETLEDTYLILIDHKKYRALLKGNKELMLYHIAYLETNWVKTKDKVENALLTLDSSKRYDAFLQDFPTLINRVALHHVASKLGITPTQLSRIRKKD